MPTTLVAKNAGSLSSVLILAIEGYEYLLTSGTAAQAVAAWNGSDWTQALPGAYFDLDNEQSIDPHKPFTSGGKAIVRVAPVAGDRFGIDTHRKRAGFETQLIETTTRATSTIKVASTASFSSSGHIHIGTECISYTGKTSAAGIAPATFTGCSRGRFVPHKTGRVPSTNFAQMHRVTLDPQAVLLQPVVSTTPRVWAGRWVGIYEHRVVDGVLDSWEEALCVFSGKIVDIEDDGKSTNIDLESVLDVLKATTLGRQLWSAKVKEGIYIKQANVFAMNDSGAGAGSSLTFVSGTPSGNYQIAQGYYTAEELHAVIDTWLAQAAVDGLVDGSYSMYVDETNDGPRTIIAWSNSTGGTVSFNLVLPNQVARFLGWTNPTTPTTTWIEDSGASGSARYWTSNEAPLRSLVDKFGNGNNTGLNFEVEDERGVFVDQTQSLPSAFNVTDPGAQWGVFLFDGNITIIGAYTSTGGVTELIRCMISPVNLGSAYNDDLTLYTVPWDAESPEINVRQVLAIEAPFAAFLKICAYSTGTVGHNHEQFDAVEIGLGLAIPGSMLGEDFEADCDALPGATDPVVSLIDKTTTFEDLIAGDLILRRAFIHWHNGKLRVGHWRTPTADAATVTLDESNKCAPSGNEDDHRTSSRETTDWQYPIARIYYDWDITSLSKNEGYRSVQVIEDPTAVDDAGGAGAVITIKVRNAFSTGAGLGSSIDDLIANYSSTMTMFTRPGRRLTRSITPDLVGQIALGDVVLVTDAHARDPATGIRAVTDLPAVVVRKSDGPGGRQIDGDVSDITGSVDLFISAVTNRDEANYSPTADVDDTYDAGDYDAGYNATTKTLRCHGYRYGDDGTLVAPLLTDAEYFPVNSGVRVTERDPADPLNPQTWDDIVASQSGDDITLTTGLAGWDNTRTYRVTPDTYSDVTSAQRLKAFQADDADALIENTAQPYLYSGAASANVFAENMNSTIGLELPPDLHHVDGAPRDVGTEQALARLFDNFADYDSAISLPALGDVMTNADFPMGWKLLAYAPINLTTEILSSSVWRRLSLAPFYRSADGSVIQLRASLCRSRPIGASLNTIDRGAVYSEATWTTSNTNWETGAQTEMDARPKDSFTGYAWLVIEGTYKCETRGMGLVQEGPRVFDNEWWVP